MTGFKSGASDDDPLGSTDSENETEAATSTVTETKSRNPESDSSETDDTPAPTTESTATLPWIFDRSSITDGRDKTVQLHLQQSTLDIQRQAKSDIETQLGETVKKADLREAAIIVGLQQTDDLTEILEEWGYGR